MREDEPAGIERGYGDLRHVKRRRLLGADRPVCVKNLQVNEERAGQAHPPCEQVFHGTTTASSPVLDEPRRMGTWRWPDFRREDGSSRLLAHHENAMPP